MCLQGCLQVEQFRKVKKLATPWLLKDIVNTPGGKDHHEDDSPYSNPEKFQAHRSMGVSRLTKKEPARTYDPSFVLLSETYKYFS